MKNFVGEVFPPAPGCEFGAYMQVHIQNDGPVTLQLETPQLPPLKEARRSNNGYPFSCLNTVFSGLQRKGSTPDKKGSTDSRRDSTESQRNTQGSGSGAEAVATAVSSLSIPEELGNPD